MLGRLLPSFANPLSIDCIDAVTRSVVIEFPEKSTGTTATQTVRSGETGVSPSSRLIVSGNSGTDSVTMTGLDGPLNNAPISVNLYGAA